MRKKRRKQNDTCNDANDKMKARKKKTEAERWFRIFVLYIRPGKIHRATSTMTRKKSERKHIKPVNVRLCIQPKQNIDFGRTSYEARSESMAGTQRTHIAHFPPTKENEREKKTAFIPGAAATSITSCLTLRRRASFRVRWTAAAAAIVRTRFGSTVFACIRRCNAYTVHTYMPHAYRRTHFVHVFHLANRRRAQNQFHVKQRCSVVARSQQHTHTHTSSRQFAFWFFCSVFGLSVNLSAISSSVVSVLSVYVAVVFWFFGVLMFTMFSVCKIIIILLFSCISFYLLLN